MRFPSNIILMLLFAFNSVGAVVFTPGFPELSRQFSLSDAQVQWMMTLFLLGTAFGRLPYGPLANRFGRKKTLFLGLFISLIGTAMILLSNNYIELCIGRVIQALGCASTLKMVYTMVGDVHAGAAATKVLSYSTMAYAILPGIGTAVSGYLLPYWGWKGGFWFFLLFNILLLLACQLLPETSKQKDLHALKIGRIFIAYSRQFKDLSLILGSILMGMTTAILFIFSQEAPFIAIEMLGISATSYGVLYLLPALGITTGSFLTIWLSDKISSLYAMLLGISVLFIGSVVMGTLLWMWPNGWALFLPQVVVQLGDILLYTNASSRGLSETEDKSNATVVMLFINSCGGFLGTFVVGSFIPRTLLSMPIVFCVMTLLMFSIWLILRTHNMNLLQNAKLK